VDREARPGKTPSMTTGTLPASAAEGRAAKPLARHLPTAARLLMGLGSSSSA